MTISKRLGIGYAVIAGVSILLMLWLGYHEFVEEPAEYRARGLDDIHKDTMAEAWTVAFLCAMPVLLAAGWWWMRRVLAPLRALTGHVGALQKDNLSAPLPRTKNGDEVDQLAEGFNEMRSRLNASFRQIHELTLQVSHELKTPLMVMRGQLETALTSHPQGLAWQEWIESQLDEVLRLARIVDALTFLTKADSGLIVLDHQPVAFDQLLLEACEDGRYLGNALGIELNLAECEPAVVSGDRQRLRQLLLILIDNAVKYNVPKGTISVSLGNRPDYCELRLTNTGDGISPETQANVFSRFVRGENAQGKVDGSGLGLSIARWIVEAHGGTIDLASVMSSTTTVRVRLARVR